MIKISTIALLVLLTACTAPSNGSIKHVSSTPIPTANGSTNSISGLPNGCGPQGPSGGAVDTDWGTWSPPDNPPSSVGGMPRSYHTSANGSSPAASAMLHGAVPVDCLEVDPAQKRCSSGSGWDLLKTTNICLLIHRRYHGLDGRLRGGA